MHTLAHLHGHENVGFSLLHQPSGPKMSAYGVPPHSTLLPSLSWSKKGKRAWAGHSAGNKQDQPRTSCVPVAQAGDRRLTVLL